MEKHFGPDFLEQMVLTRDKTVVSADLLIDDRVDITGKWPEVGGGSWGPQPECPSPSPTVTRFV